MSAPLLPSVDSVLRLGPPAEGKPSLHWRPGQALEARVLEPLSGGRVLLQIGAHRLTARTGLSLSPGQTLHLRVEHTEPTVVLRMEALQTLPVDPVRRLLPQMLGRQRPLAAALGAALLLAERRWPGPRARAFAASMLDAARRPQADAVRRALAAAGLPVAGAGTDPGGAPGASDLRGWLTALLRSFDGHEDPAAPAPEPGLPQGRLGHPLRPGPDAVRLAELAAWLDETPERRSVHRLLEGGLVRLTVHQLVSLQLSRAGEPQWVLELPVRHPEGVETVALRIRREDRRRKPGAHANGPGWQLDLAIPMGDEATLHARVALHADKALFATLWCSQQALYARVEAGLPRLGDALRAAGLEVRHLDCRQGVPPEDTEPPHGPGFPPLLDIRA
ncbi:MAG TPA: flagellar hook-length control protein FliK [Chromatiales bacterium]|nr:flagellar hook-length control protein FliK [Chromatiales bacterium]